MQSDDTAQPVSPAPAPGRVHVNGVNRCVKCGASEVRFDGSWLVCGYCQHRWNTPVLADGLRLSDGIQDLVGTSVLKGAADIDTSSLVTVQCSGCGAHISVNSETTLRATCPWCRHILTLNHPIENGVVPDAILPFFVTREDAQNRMTAYVSQRLKYASAEFRKDFATFPIEAFYLPYLVADVNATVRLTGRGWVAKGSSGSSENQQNMKFTTEEFAVMREADLAVDDLAIEARSTRSRLAAAVSTTNIISAIQPFDIANAVRFNAHYLADGVAFERRDVEISAAMYDASDHLATIARGYVNQTLTNYSGGVRWDAEEATIKGTRWITVLLPVWLYAFPEDTVNGVMMHYIAVNGRTGEIEGSVPLDEGRAKRSAWHWGLATVAIFSGPPLLFAIGASLLPLVSGGDAAPGAGFTGFALIFALGFSVVGAIVGKLRHYAISDKQRNAVARFAPERETTYSASRLDRADQRLGEFTHRGGPEIAGRNDHRPEVRAEVCRVVTADASAMGEANATGPEAADFPGNADLEFRLDADGDPWAGQYPSAAPPGAPAGQKWVMSPEVAGILKQLRKTSPSD